MVTQPGYFMNWCREATKMGVSPGNRPAAPRDWFRGVPERYVAGSDTRGRQGGRPYPWSQQVIHEISRLARWQVLATFFDEDIVSLQPPLGGQVANVAE